MFQTLNIKQSSKTEQEMSEICKNDRFDKQFFVNIYVSLRVCVLSCVFAESIDRAVKYYYQFIQTK